MLKNILKDEYKTNALTFYIKRLEVLPQTPLRFFETPW